MITQKEFLKVRDFLYRKTGIYLDDSKYTNFMIKLKPFFKEHNFDNFRHFFHKLRFGTDDEFLQKVINLITVNETYFYRENHQFDTLIDYVLPEIIKSKPKHQPIRILSAPCSTGEEPYTMALALLAEANMIEQRDFELVGIDIDTTVIQKAKLGKYTTRSVQFVPNKLMKKYFKELDGNIPMFEIDNSIKNAINFRVINIFDRAMVDTLGKFDIIFSRNMLIYFNDKSRREVGVTFYDMLNTNGYIFLGHADKMSRTSSLFLNKKVGESMVYQKV